MDHVRLPCSRNSAPSLQQDFGDFCSMRRTSTIQRTTFHLPSPNAVTFTFPARDVIEISIPDSSLWHVPSHWHYTRIDTRQIQVIHGRLMYHIGLPGTIGYTGSSMDVGEEPRKFTLDEHVEWRPLYNYDMYWNPIPQALTVRLIANAVLHRNLCSMILDYELFPELTSTPFWLKWLFRSLVFLPSVRERLLRMTLKTQLQLTLHAHDYHDRHGIVRFSKLWFWGYAPKWTYRLEWLSMMCISYLIGAACYWIGRLAFGMSVTYSEYTPAVQRGEKRAHTLD